MQRPVVLIRNLPGLFDPGAFKAVRKHDVHCGVDLYCADGAHVVAIEQGVVIAVEKFTGEHADSPWWNDTWAVLVEGDSGVFVYGEISEPMLKVGEFVAEGGSIGYVTPVLKKDKGVTPTSMLHLELHKRGTGATCWWHKGEAMPASLLDPTPILKNLYGDV